MRALAWSRHGKRTREAEPSKEEAFRVPMYGVDSKAQPWPLAEARGRGPRPLQSREGGRSENVSSTWTRKDERHQRFCRDSEACVGLWLYLSNLVPSESHMSRSSRGDQ